MTSTLDISIYRETLIFLATAGIIAPLFFRIRISPVLGYLLAGAALGPFGLGRLAGRWPGVDLFLLSNVGAIDRLAEFGVVALMFTIGLELSFERLKSLRRLVFGMGTAQMAVSTAVIAAAAAFVGQPPAAALILGAALSLSSTAIVVPVLAEHKLTNAQVGRYSFSALLFQDLAVAPLLFLVAMLTGASGGAVATLVLTLAPAALAVGVVIGAGRLVLRPLFHSVAMTKNAESFMAACLLVGLGSALIAAASGLSMALGAFLSGLLLAETEYRREIEVTIEPFKGLLLGLFFVSVGAQLDLSLAIASPTEVFGALAAFMALKTLAMFPIAWGFGATPAAARDTAIMLGPGGEFAFVLIGAASASGVIDPHAGRVGIVAAALSMLLLPVIGRFVAVGAARRRLIVAVAEAPVAPPADDDHRVIIVGYGRVGTLIGEMLEIHKIPFIGVDTDARLVRLAHSAGRPAFYGDATRAEFLKRCGIETARALVVTMNSDEANEEVVSAARKLRPDMTIVARARDAEQASKLYQLGVTDAVPETVEASLQLSEAVLVDIGVPMGFVIASIHEKRDEFRKRLVAAGAPDRVAQARRRLKPK